MKKLMLLITCLFLTFTGFSQLYEQHDTLVTPYVTDSVRTFHGYARGSVYIEIDFRTADAYDGTVGIGGTLTAYDTAYAEYPSTNNPITLNLTNFPDTICRISRTVGLSAPFLKIKLTPGSVTGGLKYPIDIVFDRY